MATVGSQTALSAAPQSVTLRDKAGRCFRAGQEPGRRDVDIRSVTLSRTSKKRLRVVVETASPLRPDTHVTFRYVDPSGFNDYIIDATVWRGGVLAYVNETISLPPGRASISGRRFTLILDFAPRGYVEWYPRFRWMVTVAAPDPILPGVRDHVPNQVDAVIDPRFAPFP